MSTDADKARQVLTEFLRRVKKPTDDLRDDLGLFGDGLELDSLEAAELSAMLEDEFGADPFSANETLPETVGEVLAFYAPAPTA